MKRNKFEEKIDKAFSNLAPDILDTVLSDCEKQKGTVIYMEEKKKINPWFKKVTAMVAALAVVIMSVWGVYFYSTTYAVASTVSLDVNPSIEIKVNQKEKVLSVDAKNQDGQKIIGDMDFKGSSLDITINAIIGSMLKNGYLSDIANSILISVDNSNEEKGAILQQKLTKEINELIQTNSFSGAVLSQTVSKDNQLQELSDKYGITLGKAQLIKEITEKDSTKTFEELVKLTINELNVLSKSKELNLEKVQAIGTASDKAYIGEEKAKEIAYNHANINVSEVCYTEIGFDTENGIMVYDVEFKAKGYEYDYEINAKTGDIIKSDKELDDDGNKEQNRNQNMSQGQNSNAANKNSSDIGAGKAKSIAVSHANISLESIRDYNIEQDCENGKKIYEIDFKSNGYEYSYDIDAQTGNIIKSDKELDD